MNIKQLIFKYKCAHQPKRDMAYPDYAKVNSILLLYESEWQERNAEIKFMLEQLHDEEKQVVSWGYCKKDKVLSPNLPDSRILGMHDFNLLDMPKSDVVQFLERHSFDLMIDLTVSPILPMQYIAMMADARFKIGAHNVPLLYDMVIQPSNESTQDYLFRQMTHYLKLIKSADK